MKNSKLCKSIKTQQLKMVSTYLTWIGTVCHRQPYHSVGSADLRPEAHLRSNRAAFPGSCLPTGSLLYTFPKRNGS